LDNEPDAVAGTLLKDFGFEFESVLGAGVECVNLHADEVLVEVYEVDFHGHLVVYLAQLVDCHTVDLYVLVHVG